MSTKLVNPGVVTSFIITQHCIILFPQLKKQNKKSHYTSYLIAQEQRPGAY